MRGLCTIALVGALGVSACGAPTATVEPVNIGELRFHNREPVWLVNDREDVAVAPEPNRFSRKLYYFDAFLHRRLTHAMEFNARSRAMDINAVEEVPDSTWFTNRIGVRDLSVEEIAAGPNTDNGPSDDGPIRVRGSKVGGKSIGLLAEDARGVNFLIKFDVPEAPELETASDAIAARLLWALGYNVPEDQIRVLRRDQLVLAEDATVKDIFGNKLPMTLAHLEEDLAQVHRRDDGSYRTLVSKYLSGVPLGGMPMEGTRPDDPNDRVPHQHRRELRALRVFLGWLQHTDVKEDNTLDMWVTDPSDPERNYVQHYLVDFGKSLGANAFIERYPGDGHAYMVDIDHALQSIFALGLWARPYEGTLTPFIPGVGMFDVEHFAPGDNVPFAPYMPLSYLDPHDAFWAVKVLMRLRPHHIRAAVEEGKLSDPRAVDYLTEVLIGRQRKAARYWLERGNSVDGFHVQATADSQRLCFNDLLVKYQLQPGASATTTLTVTAYDFDGVSLGWQKTAHPSLRDQGSVCLDGWPRATDNDGYTILSIAMQRAGKSLPPVEVHVASDPEDGSLRVIGINRH